MTENRNEILIKNLFNQIIELTPCVEEAYNALKRCGLTEQEIKKLGEARLNPEIKELPDFYQSVEAYAAGYMSVVTEEEYKKYRRYLDFLKAGVFIDCHRTAEYLVDAERKARIRDYHRRLCEPVTSDIYSAAVEHVKNAIFDSMPLYRG